MNNMISNVKWIDTESGPSVILPSSGLSVWSGVSKIDSVEKGVYEDVKDCLNPKECHYGLACFFDEEPISKTAISNDTIPILVLGQEAKSTTVVNNNDEDEIYIARILYTDTTDLIRDSFLDVNLLKVITGWEKQFEIDLDKGNYLIMHGAASRFHPSDDDESLEFSLSSGTYSVSFSRYEPQLSQNAFELFKLKKIN